jgi:putative ABC transport system substrate-binding protein
MRPHVVLDMAYEESGPRRTYGSNEHVEADGPTVFGQACKMGLEGIVSKRKNSAYRSGRSPDWLKSKNPACEALLRTGGRSRECGPPMRGEGTTRWVPDEAGHGPMRVLSFPSPSGRRDQMTFCIGRRELITLLGGVAAAWPLTARAQQSKTARIGALYIGTADAESFKKELRGGLRELGYVEGQNIAFEFRSAEGRLDRLPELAVELVALKVDVIVVLYTPSALAVQRATREIPIVVLAGDPVRLGLVASLARPGGNITGISLMAVDLIGKCVELFRDALPAVRRVAALGNDPDPFSKPMLEQIRLAGRTSGIDIAPEIMVRAPDEIDEAFARMKKDGAEAVVAQASLSARHVVDGALKHGLPVASVSRLFADAGAMMSYGVDGPMHFGAVLRLSPKSSKVPSPQTCRSNSQRNSSW